MVLFLAARSPNVVAFGGVFWSVFIFHAFNFCVMAHPPVIPAISLQFKRPPTSAFVSKRASHAMILEQKCAIRIRRAALIKVGQIWHFKTPKSLQSNVFDVIKIVGFDEWGVKIEWLNDIFDLDADDIICNYKLAKPTKKPPVAR